MIAFVPLALAIRPPEPHEGAVAVPVNADLVEPAGDDAACLKGPARPDAPGSLTVPVNLAAEAFVFTFVTRGPVVIGPNAVAVDVAWADGKTTKAAVRMGYEASSAMLPSPTARPVQVGVRDGAPVMGTRWTWRTGRATAVKELKLSPRSAEHTVCLVSIEAGAPDGVPGVRTDTTGWYTYVVGPTLAKPMPQALPVEPDAGARGFVTVGPDGHFRYEDGTRARFWGVDLYQMAAIPKKEEADVLAATLANLGFNIVRIHHVDLPLVGLVKRDGTLDPALADRLDFFLSRLKAHGIYLILEVATFRTFAEGVADPHPSIPNGHKLVTMFEDDWRDAYLAWFETMWGRKNPYTGLRFAEDPMVAMVELSNEHSILANWGPGIEGLPPAHLARLDARWNTWLKQRYADDAALAKAWAGGTRGGLQPGESLATGTVGRQPVAHSFSGAWPEARKRDLMAFYTELERAFYEAVSAKATQLGFRVPIVPTLSYLRADLLALHAPWPVTDLHFEWDVPRGAELRNESALATPREQGLLEAAAGAVEGRAFTVSELNHPFPNRYMAEAPLLWATLGLVQDWDALVWNSFPLGTEPTSESYVWDVFDFRNATVKLAQAPTASSMFRGGWVDAAGGYLPLLYSKAAVELFGATGRASLPVDVSDPGFFLSHRLRTEFGEAPVPSVAGSPPAGVGWWADPGVLLLDRPAIVARIGPPEAPRGDGGGIREVTRLRVKLAQWAAVSLASADGRPLGQGPATLAIGTRQENSGMEWAWGGHYVHSFGVAPILVEPARGSVEIAWPRKPVVRVIGPDGSPGAEVAVSPAGKGWWRIAVEGVQSPLFEVR
ncbi:MAG: hypothetical protein ACOZNI_32675 [Myxococcota bacterium]